MEHITHSSARELRFVAVSGQKAHPTTDKKERSSVRAFVMRDYLRQKSDPTSKFTPANVGERMASHISRFRSARPSSTVKPRKRRMAATRDRRSGGKPKSQRLLVPALPESKEEHSRISRLHDLDALDPFGTLDVDLDGPQTQSLLQYYQTSFWANSFACNPEARWISVALMDPAIIHATLSLVAIHRRDCFSIDLSKVYFKHRGEAMQIVARRLNNLQESLSDETLGAVALLSSSDNHFDWPEDAQTTHSQGLGHLISMRGGMETLNSNRHIQRVVGWADLLQAAMHGTRLRTRMPSVVEGASADGLIPDVDSEEAQVTPPGIVLQDLPQGTGDVLRQLRILSSLKTVLLQDRQQQLCRTFSNLLWKLEYSILDVPERPASAADHSHEHALTQDRLMEIVVGIATLIFSYLTLRDLAAPILYLRLSGRLRAYVSAMMTPLQKPQKHAEPANTEGQLLGDEFLGDSQLAIFLWSLYLGWRGSQNDVKNRTWFAEQVAQLCWRHGILSHETIRGKIQSVIPQAQDSLKIEEGFWDEVEDIIWSEMISLH
ncbi:uncharacterized protein Z520_03592 [Fonsecaea multimorphosa CBS 102226]|uniref:Transcription factor domain-containing protein n=1 Tax=Fonsecaea multimorphosa CBS 102226 TaxID=1442371 RepID=A0A0D2HGE1_9EURO|nr:uncharacterized protein Z520_03592 [Fonsecaea multimorphosa CBS 102226]KIY00926.1 hypothetical protein Z520_03592 [Fonsecaea multimorphosa CBS 102226]OAL27511.1 hypothetical protein AYO22_03415 [Fonsecaea multimorphosa]